jgi:hypothetical protein
MVGAFVGALVGAGDGDAVGAGDGDAVGAGDGDAVGAGDGHISSIMTLRMRLLALSATKEKEPSGEIAKLEGLLN